ncbi:MAG TPA: hypothetical protein VMB49_04240 [Acidobacteriaceae bacterium]|nr:hypothetical protein [Acidobacteriaceae bacterium]
MRQERQSDNQALLSCWKDIARYMGKGVRTVQRWEQEWALPVRRPNGGGAKGPVTARPAELDQWLTASWSERSASNGHHKEEDVEHLVSSMACRNPLIETSRRLLSENRTLLNELMQSLEDLQSQCSTLNPGLRGPNTSTTNSGKETTLR